MRSDGSRVFPFASESIAGRVLFTAALTGISLLVSNCANDKVIGPPPQPTKLAFTVAPSNAIAGAAITPGVRVEARDANNDLVSSYTGAITVALATNPAGGTLSGTLTVNAVAGVATFGNLSVNRSAAGYALSASAGSLPTITSALFDISPGPASQLVYVVQPTATTAGEVIAPAVELEARDAFDNATPSFTGMVTVAIAAGTGAAGATLSGTVGVAAVAGVVAFDDLSIDKAAAGYALRASSGSLTAATSAAFAIGSGTATQLVFTVEPTAAGAGDPITPAVEVTAQDALGNHATGFTGDVTVALAANPGSGTLSGTTTIPAVAGVATFTDLAINAIATGYTLSASAGGLAGATSAAFDVSAGMASVLVFTVDPTTATAGQAIAPAVQVTARDGLGNVATGFTGGVTVAIGTNPGGGTLSGTKTVTAVAGVATFADLSIDRVGIGYTLTASSGALPLAGSAGFDITPGSATQLTFTVQPSSVEAGAPITPAVEVSAQDALGNTVPGFTGDVTVAIGTNPGGGALAGTKTVTAVAGVTTFADLSIDRSGIGYDLVATSGALSSATSAAFTVAAGQAVALVFTVQPTTTTAGAPITPAVEVTAEDALGNVATGFSGDVTMAIATNPGNAALTGTTTIAAVAGVATFADLSLDKVGTDYSVSASAGGLTGATSAAFDVTPGTASALVFTVEPTTATAGQPIAPAVEVTARDAEGNTDVNFTGDVTVAIGTNPGGGTLAGTATVAAVAGVATFADLSVDKVGTGYTLSASSGAISGGSASFDILHGSVAQLAFMVQPSDVTAGQAITPAVAVSARDALGNTVTDFTDPVTVAIGTNPAGGTLAGTTTIAAVAGVATFADLSIDRSGTGYDLVATSGVLTSPASAAFTVTAGAAVELVYTVQPATTTAGAPITPAVVVTAEDAQGNVATGFTGDVTVAIGTNPGGGTLAGTTTMAAVAGVATFTDLSLDKVGIGYTLSASAGGVTGATSAAFNVTPGTASALAFTVQPTTATAGEAVAPAVQVTARDAQGNTDVSYAANVTVAITSGTGTGGAVLSGVKTVAAVAGVATFADLSIDKAGTGYTLTATSGALSDTSAAFSIDVGAPAQLVFTQTPATATAGEVMTPPVEVTTQDAVGNTVTSFTGDVTVTIGTNPGGGTLSGTATVAAVGGLATFADLSIDKSGAGYTLTASASGLPDAASAAFDVAPGAATQLVFTAQPTNATAGNGSVGGVITPAVTVTARDGFGNVDPTFAELVTLALVTNPGDGTLFNGSVAATAGVATFPNLAIDSSGRGYTLQANSTGLSSPVSVAFDIDPGPGSQLIFGIEPTTTTVGATMTPSVRVRALDVLGNTATGFNGGVTVAIAPGTGAVGAVLSGTLTRTAVAGVAVFTNLSINLVGTGYALSATAASIPVATSALFDVIPSTPTMLVFGSQPGTSTAGNGTTVSNFLPLVEVVARDAAGQRINDFTDNITLTITPGTGATGAVLRLAGATPATAAAVGGTATFNNLSIDRSATDYRLTAEITSGPFAGLTGVSEFFDITAGPADHLGFLVQPSVANANVAIVPPVEVVVQDVLNNRVRSFAGDVSVGIGDDPSGGAATLSGTTTKAASQGVASFSDLRIDVSEIGYTLLATASGLASATSSAFDIAPGSANQLVFTQQPSDAAAGASISPAIQVTARDALGNTLTGFGGAVTMTITSETSPAGVVLMGTTVVSAVNGVATFSDLSITRRGGYRLSATAVGLAGARSNSFTINPAAPAVLDFLSHPGTTAAGQTIASFSVRAKDTYGNVTTAYTGDVTVAISTNPGGGTLSGTATVAAVAGSATFADLSIDKSGTGYRLQASATGLTLDISNSFNINPGAADHLVFTIAPSNAVAGANLTPAVQVTVFDALDNVATDFTGQVTLAVTPGTGTAGATLDGTTTVAAGSGVATFSAINIKLAGTGYRLSASATGLGGATSSTFDIGHAAASQLVFTVQPSSAGAGAIIAPPVVVSAQDQFGNVATGFAGNVTLAIGTNPGTPPGILFGTLQRSLVAGVATYDDLRINSAGVGYTLVATTSGLPSGTSSAFTITP